MTGLAKSHKQTDPPKAAGPWIPTGGWLVIVALIILALLLAYQNKSYTMSLDKDGKFLIDVRANETLDALLTEALKKNRSAVEKILRGEQYYNVNDPDLVDKLANLDASKPETEEISKRLRKLLWDLRGPFAIPLTLSGADERMSKALDALETARRESKSANGLLVELWKQSLQGEGIFWPRSFNATVEIVQGAQPGKILACPGDAIATVGGVLMSLSVEDGANVISAEVEQDPSLFHCDGSPLTAEELLAEGGAPRLGLSGSTFRNLVSASESGIREGRTHATFRLYSKYMTGIGGAIVN
jgi:hypothetical protein